MFSAGPCSLDLMTRFLSDRAPTWEEVYDKPLTSTHSSSILSDMVNRLERQPVGWFPPLQPSFHPYINQNSPPALTSVTLELLDFGALDSEHPDIREDTDSASPASSSSTLTGSVYARSPSPPAPARKSNIKQICSGTGSPEPSPLPAPRKKEREKMRQRSGVKSKTSAPRRRVGVTLSSESPSELVQCRWTGCTQQLLVDYEHVAHWARHIRGHSAAQQQAVRCRWNGGCGAIVHKSSIWKHVVVHEPRFKLRCPRGCPISTRGDMMARHLRSCRFVPPKTKESMGLGEGSHVGGRKG